MSRDGASLVARPSRASDPMTNLVNIDPTGEMTDLSPRSGPHRMGRFPPPSTT